MKKLVVFFYVDALNSSFVTTQTMPFLSSLGNKYLHKELENVIGYSFAIQSCLLSGKHPDETNHWMPYFYSPDESPLLFKTLNRIGTMLPLDNVPFLRYLLERGSRKFVLKGGAQANNIPLCEIGNIALYPYYYMCELPFFFEFKEFLDKTSQTKLTYIGPPKVRTQLYTSLLEHVKKSEHEVEIVIAYDDKLDSLGHTFGPYSAQCLQYSKSIDKILSTVYQKLRTTFGGNLDFLVFSDHGQCDCTSKLDLVSELRKTGLRLGDDYLCFIDATMALFWPDNPKAKEKILKVLRNIKMGRVIDENLQKKYRLSFSDRRYGELLFALNPGGTFLPNFFAPIGAMKGLHGYLPEDSVQKGFLISNRKMPQPPRHVKDLRSLLIDISEFEKHLLTSETTWQEEV